MSPARHTRLWRRTSFFLLSIVPLGGSLRILAFGGLVGTDDHTYAELAHPIITGRFLDTHSMGAATVPLLVAVLAPTALSFRLFGTSEVALAVYPFPISLLSIFLAFLAGRLFFNERVALIAAGLQALIPVDVRYSTLLFPDLAAAFWVNIAILLMFRATKQLSMATKLAHGLLSGLALALSWLSKGRYVFSSFLRSLSPLVRLRGKA